VWEKGGGRGVPTPFKGSWSGKERRGCIVVQRAEREAGLGVVLGGAAYTRLTDSNDPTIAETGGR
jgi:hypothetical protein